MEYGKAKLNLMRNFCTAMMNLHYKSPLLLVFLWTEFQFTENNSHIFSIKMQFSTENKTKMKLDIRSRKDKSFLAGDIKRQTSRSERVLSNVQEDAQSGTSLGLPVHNGTLFLYAQVQLYTAIPSKIDTKISYFNVLSNLIYFQDFFLIACLFFFLFQFFFFWRGGVVVVVLFGFFRKNFNFLHRNYLFSVYFCYRFVYLY